MLPSQTLVLIGFAEALSAPEVVWSLRDAGFRVAAFSRRGRRAALRHSRFVSVHAITPPETNIDGARAELAALLDSLAGNAAPVAVLPLDDPALWLCNQLRGDGRWLLAGATGAQASVALDKHQQIREAAAAGFNVPDSTFAARLNQIDAASVSLPAILRPARAVVAVDNRIIKGRNWICSERAELERVLASDFAGEVLVQPFIRGEGEGVFGLATSQGVLAWSAHRRVRMMNPHGSGSSACESRAVADDVKHATETFLERTGWRGLFMVELLRDGSGKRWFVEFNGRPWGSMALSRRQGLEYPAWAVEHALDASVRIAPPIAPPRAIRCRNVGRELMHLLFVARGPRSKALRGSWPSFWRTTVDLLRVQHGDALYNWRRDDPKVFFSDSWYTILGSLHKSKN